MGIFSVVGDKFKTGFSNMGRGISNIIKRPIRKTRLEFHFKRAGERRLVTYKQYEPIIEYLKGINDHLVNEVEVRMGKVDKELMPQVEELYRFCGPYTDPKLIEFEQKYASQGTIFHVTSATTGETIKGEEEEDFHKEKIKINGKEFPFRVPPKKVIYFKDDDRKEEVTFFGYEKIEFWNDEYCEFIDKVCDHAKKSISKANQQSTIKEDQLKYIDEVQSIYKEKVGYLFGEKAVGEEGQTIGGYEKKWHTDYLRRIHVRLIADYDSLMTSILKIVPQNIKYKHSYKIAVPVLRGYDGKEIDKLEYHGINPSTDERGWPWEVDDEGKIMIGPNKGKTVPEHMIKYEKLIRIASWVVNEWDAYRDDLRDGRYHPESLTVTDYLMANHYSAGEEWKRKDEKRLTNDDRKYVMRLHDGRIVNGTRVADNLNPAFDLRAFEEEEKGVVGIPKRGKEWTHIGRKYYYADCSEIAIEEQKDPAATTRGTTMFLIDKFLSESMLMSEAHEDIKHIGEFAGLDYGPRAFGAPLCTDLFNIDLSSANISTKPYKKS